MTRELAQAQRRWQTPNTGPWGRKAQSRANGGLPPLMKRLPCMSSRHGLTNQADVGFHRRQPHRRARCWPRWNGCKSPGAPNTTPISADEQAHGKRDADELRMEVRNCRIVLAPPILTVWID